MPLPALSVHLFMSMLPANGPAVFGISSMYHFLSSVRESKAICYLTNIYKHSWSVQWTWFIKTLFYIIWGRSILMLHYWTNNGWYLKSRCCITSYSVVLLWTFEGGCNYIGYCWNWGTGGLFCWPLNYSFVGCLSVLSKLLIWQSLLSLSL